jgi:hypothetical protein
MYMLWRFLQNQMQCIVACFLTITRAIAAEAARQRRKFVLRSLLEASEIDKQELYEYVPANIYMRNGKKIDVEVLRHPNEEDRFDVRVRGGTAIVYPTDEAVSRALCCAPAARRYCKSNLFMN